MDEWLLLQTSVLAVTRKKQTNEPRLEKRVFGFQTRCDTNGAVQSHKMARGWKFRIYEVEIVLPVSVWRKQRP